MTPKTPYSRSRESTDREKTMRDFLAPLVLKSLGEVISHKKIGGMQMISVNPASGSPLTIWVKCAWKPEYSGNCAVQMAFPTKEKRAQSADEAVNIVVELTNRAKKRGATHLLLLAADNDGRIPLAAYLLSVEQVGTLMKEAVSVDESLTRNGASPSVYITGIGNRQAALVEIVRKHSTNLLELTKKSLFDSDAIEDLSAWPEGGAKPEKTCCVTISYSRNPQIRTFAINRAGGRCEYCGEQGFLMSDGKSHYLEAHHIIALANDGEDTVKNVIALCPKHHREAHYGAGRTNLEAEMVRLITDKLQNRRGRTSPLT